MKAAHLREVVEQAVIDAGMLSNFLEAIQESEGSHEYEDMLVLLAMLRMRLRDKAEALVEEDAA